MTHLIAAVPAGKKFEFALQWNVKVVSLEWLTDSMERRMALDEKLYDPKLPQEERGKGAFKKLPAETTPLGKRMRIAAADDGEGKRKLRRTASTKLGSQSSAIWVEITTGSFSTKPEEDDLWQDLKSDGLVSNQVVSALSKTEIRKTTSLDQLDGSAEPRSQSKRNTGFFEGRIIYVYGFDRVKTGILQEHLHQNGAHLALTPEQLCSHEDSKLEAGFLITPSDVARDALEDLPIVAEGLTRVNEWWVENCLYKKKIIDPTDEVICKPFPRIPIPEFDNLVVTSTSFTDYDRLHVSKAVKLMGATYDEILKESVSVLICNSDSPVNPKVKFCLDRSIPVVTPSWLWSCISTGTRQPFKAHLLQSPSERSRESSQQAQARESTSASAEPSTKERVLRERGSHNKLALSNDASPDRPNAGQKQSFSRLDPGKPGKRHPNKRAVPLYESSGEEDATAGGPGQAGLPDDDPVPPYDAPSHQNHLQELSPSEANAPRKTLPVDRSPADDQAAVQRKEPQRPSRTDTNTIVTPPTSLAKPPTATSTTSAVPAPPPADSAALNTTMAALLAQKKQNQSARPGSAGSDTGNGGGVARKDRRNRRQLGRAPSVTSTTSAPSSLSAQNSFTTANASASHAAAPGEADGTMATTAARWTDPVPLASQALVWGDVEGEAERVEVIKRLGGKVAEVGGEGDGRGSVELMRVVEGIGRVQDAGDVGTGGRVMRRRPGGGRAL